MYSLSEKEIDHVKVFQKSLKVKEINGFGNIFIDYSCIIAKKKLYGFYIEYLEKILLTALEISKKHNNSTYICHINLKNLKIKNISYTLLKMANNKIKNNTLLQDTLKEANFYCKDKITKIVFTFLYNLVDNDTKKKYRLIYD